MLHSNRQNCQILSVRCFGKSPGLQQFTAARLEHKVTVSPSSGYAKVAEGGKASATASANMIHLSKATEQLGGRGR